GNRRGHGHGPGRGRGQGPRVRARRRRLRDEAVLAAGGGRAGPGGRAPGQGGGWQGEEGSSEGGRPRDRSPPLRGPDERHTRRVDAQGVRPWTSTWRGSAANSSRRSSTSPASRPSAAWDTGSETRDRNRLVTRR